MWTKHFTPGNLTNLTYYGGLVYHFLNCLETQNSKILWHLQKRLKNKLFDNVQSKFLKLSLIWKLQYATNYNRLNEITTRVDFIKIFARNFGANRRIFLANGVWQKVIFWGNFDQILALRLCWWNWPQESILPNFFLCKTKIFSSFLLLSLVISMYRLYFLMLQTLKLNSKNLKNKEIKV